MMATEATRTRGNFRQMPGRSAHWVLFLHRSQIFKIDSAISGTFLTVLLYYLWLLTVGKVLVRQVSTASVIAHTKVSSSSELIYCITLFSISGDTLA